jgi:hypothetical protein
MPLVCQMMRMKAAVNIALLGVASAIACGQAESDSTDQGTGGTGANGGGTAGSGGSVSGGGSQNGGTGGGAAGGIPIGDSFAFKDAVATDAWCAPDAQLFEQTACCDDAPCNGLCYQGNRGLECECFGIVGGCKNGTICCSWAQSCTAPLGCTKGP